MGRREVAPIGLSGSSDSLFPLTTSYAMNHDSGNETQGNPSWWKCVLLVLFGFPLVADPGSLMLNGAVRGMRGKSGGEQ